MKTKGKFLGKFSGFRVSKYSKVTFAVPALIIFVAILMIVILGTTGGSFSNAVNIGIDFEGGTIMTVELGQDALDNYDAESVKIRNTIEDHGVAVSYMQLQRADDVTKTGIVFRYKNVSKDDAEIAKLNDEIIADVDALYPEIKNSEVNFITYESIGATAASDLLTKAGIALAVSTLLILIYIMIRFTPMSAVAAVAALLHDVLIMFALTVICRVQINTSFVAAVITIIAYSINNTIIIFDRCRESMKPLKGQTKIDYNGIGDMSVRDNMRRSIFTTLTTMITVVFLAILGGDTIREFCVPILLGLAAGLYSSVFMATPMWAGLSAAYDRYKQKRLVVINYEQEDEDGENEDKQEEKAKAKAVRSAAKSDKTSPAKDDAKALPAAKASDTEPFAKAKEIDQKPAAKPVYKYSKKNTSFKKKK